MLFGPLVLWWSGPMVGWSSSYGPLVLWLASSWSSVPYSSGGLILGTKNIKNK